MHYSLSFFYLQPEYAYLFMRTNSIFDKTLELFSVAKDADLSADEGFKKSFSNVVNFFLLVYSIAVGFYALFSEEKFLAYSNLVFSVLYILYFLVTFVFKASHVFRVADRIVIFVYFLVAFVNSCLLGYPGMTSLIYPFMALILHGRRYGILLSIAQIILMIACYAVLLIFEEIFTPQYTIADMAGIVAAQIIAVFVYYVAIAWMSTLIYDKIREVVQLNDIVNVKGELIKMLVSRTRSSAVDIQEAAARLTKDRMTARQIEIVAEMRASADNMLFNINSIDKASVYNIRPIEFEDTTFNIYTLVSNALQLYADDRHISPHSVVMASEVPQNLRGKGQFTRQIFLNLFDALDRKADMRRSPVKITVSLSDISSKDLLLNFNIAVETTVMLDRRDLSSSESRLIEFLDLDMTRRMILADRGEFAVSQGSEALQIDFTLGYKEAEMVTLADPELAFKLSKDLQKERAHVNLQDANVLIVDDNVINQKIIALFIQNRVRNVTLASNGREALQLFENNKFDIVLMDLQMPEMDGFTTTRKMREIESVIGNQVPIIAVTANAYDGNEEQCLAAGMNGYICKPFEAEALLKIMSDNLE